MKKKVLTTIAVAICAIALVIGSIAGTVAYLSVKVSVTNTFSYGKVTITMDERRVDKNGKPATDSLTDRNNGNDYMLMPGTTYTKDPIIHIGAESQPMYLFLKVDNGIAGLAMTDADKTEINGKRGQDEQVSTVHEQLLANGWKVYVDEQGVAYQTETRTSSNGLVEEPTTAFSLLSTSTVYYFSVGAGVSDTAARIVDPTTKIGNMATGDIPTISYFTTGLANVTEETMTAYVNNDSAIVITAFAVQGIGDAINTVHAAADIFKSEFTSAIPTPSN